MLVRIPSLYLLAALQRRVFERIRDFKRNGVWTIEGDAEIRREERVMLKKQWSVHPGKKFDKTACTAGHTTPPREVVGSVTGKTYIPCDPANHGIWMLP